MCFGIKGQPMRASASGYRPVGVYLIGRRVDAENLLFFFSIDIEFPIVAGDRSLELATSIDGRDTLNAFEKVESWPTIEQIERHLRKLGCTKEQVRRHLDQVAMSRIEAAKEKRRRARHNTVNWP